MKSALLIFFSAFLCAAIFGQSTIFAPLGSVWRFNEAVISGSEGSRQYRYTASHDTTIGNIIARNLKAEKWENGQFVPASEADQWVSISSDKVYYRVNDTFVLLFNFAAGKGDTIYSRVQQLPTLSMSCFMPVTLADFAYVIDSTSQIFVDGISLRVQFVHSVNDEPWVLHQIIERVGVVDGETWFGSGAYCILAGFPAKLRCYRDNEITFLGNIYNQPCDFISSSETTTLKDLINIYPNQFESDFFVEIPSDLVGAGKIRLFSALANQIFEMPLEAPVTRVSGAGFSSGVYYWEILHKNTVVAAGKVLKR